MNYAHACCHVQMMLSQQVYRYAGMLAVSLSWTRYGMTVVCWLLIDRPEASSWVSKSSPIPCIYMKYSVLTDIPWMVHSLLSSMSTPIDWTPYADNGLSYGFLSRACTNGSLHRHSDIVSLLVQAGHPLNQPFQCGTLL